MNEETEDRTPVVTGSPDEIWLVYGELEQDDTHDELSRSGDVAWSPNQEFPSDVRYVRADFMPQWRPIETFPIHEFNPELWFRDGKSYLLWCDRHTVIGRYGYTRRGKGRFLGPYGAINPTHWVPLPEPPK